MKNEVIVTTTVSEFQSLEDEITKESAEIPPAAQAVIDIAKAVQEGARYSNFDLVFKAAVQAVFGPANW